MTKGEQIPLIPFNVTDLRRGDEYCHEYPQYKPQKSGNYLVRRCTGHGVAHSVHWYDAEKGDFDFPGVTHYWNIDLTEKGSLRMRYGEGAY